MGSNPNSKNALSPHKEGHTSLILMGEFGRAQGLKGEIRVKSYTGNPRDLNAYGPLSSDDGRVFILENLRQAPGGAADILVAKVKNVNSREEAEKLNRLKLFIERDKLPAPEDEDEFFLADLVGLTASTQEGETVGTIIGLPNYGGGDLLEIRPQRGPTLLLPFTKAFVPIIDVAAKEVIVVLPLHVDEDTDNTPDAS
jgi:16S rRNA processing protein RimM